MLVIEKIVTKIVDALLSVMIIVVALSVASMLDADVRSKYKSYKRIMAYFKSDEGVAALEQITKMDADTNTKLHLLHMRSIAWNMINFVKE